MSFRRNVKIIFKEMIKTNTFKGIFGAFLVFLFIVLFGASLVVIEMFTGISPDISIFLIFVIISVWLMCMEFYDWAKTVLEKANKDK